MGRQPRIDIAVPGRALVGEGPVWDVETRRLIWVDIPAGLVHRFDPATGATGVFEVGKPVGAVVPRARGGWLLAVADGFAFADTTWQRLDQFATVRHPWPESRFNDGKCDPAGRFWAGTMAYDQKREAAVLYRLSADLTVQPVLSQLSVSNGLAWTADARTMYYIDSPTRRIDAFDYDRDAGTIRNRRPLVHYEGEGNPDGMTLDVEGCLWVATSRGGTVRRYTPQGKLDRVIELPVGFVTSCAFGGKDLDTLFITTGTRRLTPEQRASQPDAGSVFAIQPGVQGSPPDVFAG